jgi:hypothetical protein
MDRQTEQTQNDLTAHTQHAHTHTHTQQTHRERERQRDTHTHTYIHTHAQRQRNIPTLVDQHHNDVWKDMCMCHGR